MFALLAILDDPMATDDLCRTLTCIGDPDFVGEYELLLARIRLLRHKMRLDRD